MQRRQSNVFLILFLVSIAAFVIASQERDKLEADRTMRNMEFISRFIPQVNMEFHSDTISVYVDADTLKNVLSHQPILQTTGLVRDIGVDDSVEVEVAAVLRDNVLISPRLVRLGDRIGVGALEDRMVRFPVQCDFSITGSYAIQFETRAKRIHAISDSVFGYRAIKIPISTLTAQAIEFVERGVSSLVVNVVDTSLARPMEVKPLVLTLERASIQTAAGYEESNIVAVTPVQGQPSVRLLRGPGRLVAESSVPGELRYRWIGKMDRGQDSVVIEAHANRGAGGRDIARTGFAVSAAAPFHESPVPALVYAGEELSCNLRVDGLRNENAYSWRLVEVLSTGQTAAKDSGRGSSVRFRIPNTFAGKLFRLHSFYDGKPYRVIRRVSYQATVSRYDIPVVAPPTRIRLSLPPRVPTSHTFSFSASKYSDPRFEGEQPLSGIRDISIRLVKEDRTPVRTALTMMSRGRFQFTIENKKIISRTGETVLLTIESGTTVVKQKFILYREGN